MKLDPYIIPYKRPTSRKWRQPTEWQKVFANHTSDKRIAQQWKEAQWKTEQKIWTDTSPKKINRWPLNTWKDVQYY